MSRGCVSISNVFLSASLVYLASDEAGCVVDGEIPDEGCHKKVYGMKPASLVANIAVVAGLLACITMPFFGAVVDSTNHRRTVGVVSAILLMSIQAAQIGTVASTWLLMSILQAVAGFLYQVVVLACYSYLPEVARVVGQKKMEHRKFL